MAPNPEQIPSRACGCPDCLIDLPPAQYGGRPQHDGYRGPWRARHRVDGNQRTKNLSTRREAVQFLAAVQPKARRHAS